MTFTFIDKTSYLAYRKEWAERYLDQIKAVRAAKQELRDANRAYAKDAKGISRLWDAHHNRHVAHQDTIELLEELWAAKAEAGRQMRANTQVA